MYSAFFKRGIDLIIALSALTVLLPVFLLIMVALAFVNKQSPFFTQLRPGLHVKPFFVIKFKTMNDKCDAQGNLLPDEQRLTRLGKLVRKTSLDEIPQLLNVIKGDMSLVGPRPLLMEYVPLYSPEQRKRHNVRPGITGWAQVNGRNSISWEDKFAYDVWYVNNLSFMFDVKILILTLLKVLKAEGISSATSATMEKFKGNKIA